MEKLMKIVQVYPTVERPYTDKSGNAQVFTSRAFLLTDGIDTVYAEMQGDMARANAQTQYDTLAMHTVQMQASVRTWKDANGFDRFSNELKIVKIV